MAEPTPAVARSVFNRIVDLTKAVITLKDHLGRLDRSDAELEAGIDKLSRRVIRLSEKVSELSGQMKSVEKRLDDKETAMKAVVKLALKEAVDEMRKEKGKIGKRRTGD